LRLAVQVQVDMGAVGVVEGDGADPALGQMVDEHGCSDDLFGRTLLGGQPSMAVHNNQTAAKLP